MIFDFDFKSLCVFDSDFDFKIILRLIMTLKHQNHPSNHQILQVALQGAGSRTAVTYLFYSDG